MSQKPVNRASSRRKFILDAAAATGGAMAVTVAGASPAAPATASAPGKKSARGYRETDHIRTYYDKARI